MIIVDEKKEGIQCRDNISLCGAVPCRAVTAQDIIMAIAIPCAK